MLGVGVGAALAACVGIRFDGGLSGLKGDVTIAIRLKQPANHTRTSFRAMVISLAEARAAAERQDWWAILGFDFFANNGVKDVQKARRAFMQRNHPDKGGNVELCQIFNNAADWLEVILDVNRRQRQEEREWRDEEEEWRAREEERRARLERARAEELERERRLHEELVQQQRAQRTKANFMMIETVHQRTRNKITLGEYAAKAFPMIHRRICKMHQRRKAQQSRLLTYAVETEIAARRANREDRWPKTIGLETRCPTLAAELAVLKKAYDKAYQNLRYLRGRNKPHAHALLATRRLLSEAWMAYLALPAPMRDVGRFGTCE